MSVLLATNETSLECLINGILAEVVERAEVGFRFCASLEWEGKTRLNSISLYYLVICLTVWKIFGWDEWHLSVEFFI